MENPRSVSTDTWVISLPGDWVEKESTEYGALNFESADGAKAMYITTWELPDGEGPRMPKELAESFKNKSVEALHDMEGYSWQLVDDVAGQTGATAVVLVDHLAEANGYRIVTKILARPPVVVRASFHDYLCEDYEISREFFAPVVHSLRLREAV